MAKNKKKSTKKSILKKKKSQWFMTGVAKVNSEYTFSIDVISGNTGFKYNKINLGIEISKGHTIYVDGMGGYYPGNKDKDGNPKQNLIYVNDKDDFANRFEVDFEDRFNKKILESVNGMNFIKVGLEKTADGKVHIERFLSKYDAIEYIEEHLEDGMVVNVTGKFQYRLYQGELQIVKELQGIYLSDKAPEDYKATFTQTILVDKESIDKDNVEDDLVPIYAMVPEYIKDYDGKLIKEILAFPVTFYFDLKEYDAKTSGKIMKKFLTAKKGVTEITVEGEMRSSVEVTEISDEDIPEDMKQLIEMGIYTKEQILGKLTIKGSGVQKMVIIKPFVQKVKDGEEVSLKLLHFPDKYKESEVLNVYSFASVEEKDDEEDADLDELEKPEDDDMAWLNQLEDDEEDDEE